MKQVILVQHDGPRSLELYDVTVDVELAKAKVSYYIYHWEASQYNPSLIRVSTPIRCKAAKCSIWFESLEYFNAQRLL